MRRELFSEDANGRGPRSCPHLLMVHDLMPVTHPELFERKFALYSRTFVPLSVRLATRVVTPSRHVQRQLQERHPRADVRVLPGAGVWTLPEVES